MVDPLWFADGCKASPWCLNRCGGLLGVIVSFYFGARHQVKSQQFQREIVGTMAHVPQVMDNITPAIARPNVGRGRYGA